MPTVLITNSFKADFSNLSQMEQKQSKKALRILAENPRYPSLQIHKIKGTLFREAYVNKDIRLIFEQNGDTLILHAIGHHDILRNY